MRGVGIIGTGKQGADHARRIASFGADVSLVAVTDLDSDRAHRIATEVGCSVASSDGALIEDPRVDAVIVASFSETHPEHVLACIAAGKPVLCEKPLAVTAAGCVRVIDAEIAAGRRFTQVGFMRRFDPEYLRLKAAIEDDIVGEPLVLHCIHRNQSAPPAFRTTQTLTDSVIHEIDCARWLLGEEIVSVAIEQTRPSPNASERLADPLLVRLEAKSGVRVDVEAFVNAGYGYDVRCEVVGSKGYVSMEPLASRQVTIDTATEQGIAPDWLSRFATAYDAELHRWIEHLDAPDPTPSAWDGYAATVVAEACVRALQTGRPEPVTLGPRPSLYAT